MNADSPRGSTRAVKRVRELIKTLYAEVASNKHKHEREILSCIARRVQEALEGDL